MNPTHAAQRMRSAIAPVISAGVITANVSWNATNAIAGIAPLGATEFDRPFSPTASKLPSQPASPNFPNASE